MTVEFLTCVVIAFATSITICFVFPAARVLLCVRVVCLQSVFGARANLSMKRGKKTEDAAADEENDTGSGTTAVLYIKTLTHIVLT